MSLNKTMLGRSVGIAVVGSVGSSRRYYLRATIPEVMLGRGYETRLEEVSYPGKKKCAHNPTVMIFKYWATETVSPPNALKCIMEVCEVSPPRGEYISPIDPKMSPEDFFEKIVGDSFWAPKTQEELEDAVHILGLKKMACHPL